MPMAVSRELDGLVQKTWALSQTLVPIWPRPWKHACDLASFTPAGQSHHP